MSLSLTGLLHREADGKLKHFPPPRQVPVSPIPQITGIEGKEPLMKPASRLILAMSTALVLAGATMAGAQAVVAPKPAATTETAAPSFEDIKAELKVDLILKLAEHGYPPVTRDEVYKEIFEQAENFRKYRE